MQEIICVRIALGLEKACLVQMRSKGKPSNTITLNECNYVVHNIKSPPPFPTLDRAKIEWV